MALDGAGYCGAAGDGRDEAGGLGLLSPSFVGAYRSELQGGGEASQLAVWNVPGLAESSGMDLA